MENTKSGTCHPSLRNTLEGVLGLQASHFRRLERPRGVLRGPRSVQERPMSAQERPESVQNVSKRYPRAPQRIHIDPGLVTPSRSTSRTGEDFQGRSGGGGSPPRSVRPKFSLRLTLHRRINFSRPLVNGTSE